MAGEARVIRDGVARDTGVDEVDGEGVLKPPLQGHHYEYSRSECVWYEI